MNDSQKEYIKSRMVEFASNIEEYSIGEEVIDNSDNTIATIKNKTLNSIEVLILAKSEKGVNSTQWFEIFKFNKTFKKK